MTRPRAITPDDAFRWGPWFGGVLLVVAAGGVAWGAATVRTDDLETRVRSDHELLERIDKRVGLLVCKQDPKNCAP